MLKRRLKHEYRSNRNYRGTCSGSMCGSNHIKVSKEVIREIKLGNSLIDYDEVKFGYTYTEYQEAKKII